MTYYFTKVISLQFALCCAFSQGYVIDNSVGLLWNKDGTDMLCQNSIDSHDVSNQLDCQHECEANVACVGIAYSRNLDYASYCIVCLDDVLSPSISENDFYRKSTVPEWKNQIAEVKNEMDELKNDTAGLKKDMAELQNTLMEKDEKPEVWNCATAEYGKYCQFPFIHNGVMHHNCINLNKDEPEEVHCASSTLGNGIAKDIKKCLLDSCVLGCRSVAKSRCLFPFTTNNLTHTTEHYHCEKEINGSDKFQCATKLGPKHGESSPEALEIEECDMPNGCMWE